MTQIAASNVLPLASTNIVTPMDIIALSKAVSDKEVKAARPEVTAGTYTVDESFRVSGTVTVGADYEQAVMSKATADFAKMLVVALSKLNGVTMEVLAREAEAITDEQVSAVKEQAQQSYDTIYATLARKVVTKMKGKVTAKLEISKV